MWTHRSFSRAALPPGGSKSLAATHHRHTTTHSMRLGRAYGALSCSTDKRSA